MRGIIAVAAASTEGPLMGGLDAFLAEPSPWHALGRWIGLTPRTSRLPSKDEIGRGLARDLAQLDELVTRQVSAILHHPAFQRLEASWRGLRHLVEHLPEGEAIKIRVLSVSWKELVRDLEKAIEYDQSHLFRKIYNEEFGTPGGEPYGVLIGDFEIHHRPSKDHPTDDVGAVMNIAAVSAAAFAPFIAGVHPSFFDLTSFSELERPLNLPRTFEQVEYLKWRAFRHSEDARFIALTLPRILLRLPYRDDGSRNDRFRYREEVEDPSQELYLWGNACYAFAAVLVRAYADSGWLADIRGIRPGLNGGGGMAMGLPVNYFRTDREGIAPKCSVDAIVTDQQEKELGELGFMPLCYCQGTEFSAFYSNQSVQRVKKYDSSGATANAKLSAMLQYILCVSRIAHYLKVMGRDKVGSFQNPEDCQDYLQRWILNYCMANDDADLETKARYPLREGQVQVREHAGKPGSYYCVIHLRPHFQLDQMVAAVRLTTEMTPASG
jgi:type VI secretion system ImpC/EvpB family protein